MISRFLCLFIVFILFIAIGSLKIICHVYVWFIFPFLSLSAVLADNKDNINIE